MTETINCKTDTTEQLAQRLAARVYIDLGCSSVPLLRRAIAKALRAEKANQSRLCNRSACRQPGANWWNATMQAWYCQPCAFAINESTPGLCVRV